MNRVASLSMTIVLATLCLLATAAGAVALWKVPSGGAALLTLGWIVLGIIAYFSAKGRSWAAAIGVTLVVMAAMEVRFASIGLVEAGRIGADAMNYKNLAQAVLDGRGLITDDWRYGEGLRAYFPPLYPVALAGWWAIFGSTAASTLAMNTLISAASSLCIRDIGARLGQRNAGNFAALIWFAWPSFTLSAALPNKEMLMLLLVMLFFRTVIVWQADPDRQAQWRHSIAMGLLWAAMALTQAALALAPPVIGLILMPRNGWRATLAFGLRALPFFVAAMLPWWIRNWMIFGQFVPFTTAAGFLVNVALDKYALPIPPDVFALSEPERSGHMARLAFARIAEMPLNFLESVFIAFGRGFGYEEGTIAAYRHSTPPITPELRALWTPPLQFAWAGLLGDAAYGCWRSYRDRDNGPLVPLLFAAFVSLCAINMWFEFGERHRLMLTPLLMLVAAAWLMKPDSRSEND